MAYDVERKPGMFAKAREKSHLHVALVFMLLVFVAGALAFAQIFTGTAGLVTSLALVAVAYAAKDFFDVRFDAGIRWGKGGNAEVAIGTDLEALRTSARSASRQRRPTALDRSLTVSDSTS